MWNSETELNFLEIYQTEPVLWEPNHKFHKDKKKLHDAWTRISHQTGFPVEELKKKKDSLMATYRGHFRKIQNSLKSGTGLEKVYKPIWFAFDLMNSFLGHLYKCKDTINTENQDYQPSTSGENNDREVTDEDFENTEGATTQNNDFPGPPTQRRRRNPPELAEAGRNMKDAIQTLNKVLQKKAEDDCDKYGQILANKLRKLTEEERLKMMYEIDGLFIKLMQNKSLPSNRYRHTRPSPVYGVSSPSPAPQHYVSPSLSPKYVIQCSTPSPIYSVPHTYSTQTERSSPQPVSRSAHSPTTDIPVIHIPETNQPVQPPSQSQQITILTNELISPTQDIISAAFFNAKAP